MAVLIQSLVVLRMFRIKKAAHVVTFACRMPYNCQGLAKESAHSVNVGGGSCGAGVVPSVGETFILPVVMKLPVESYVTPGTVMKSKLWGTIRMKLHTWIYRNYDSVCQRSPSNANSQISIDL